MACVSVILTAVFTLIASGLLSPKDPAVFQRSTSENQPFTLPQNFDCNDNGVICIRAGKIEMEVSYTVETQKSGSQTTVSQHYETIRSSVPFLRFSDSETLLYENNSYSPSALLSLTLTETCVTLTRSDKNEWNANLLPAALSMGESRLSALMKSKLNKPTRVRGLGGKITASLDGQTLKTAGIEERYSLDTEFLNLKNVSVTFYRNLTVKAQ